MAKLISYRAAGPRRDSSRDGTVSNLQEEHTVTCPYCWSEWTVLLDLSVASQTYIEDCAICCNPVSIHYSSDEGRLEDVTAQRSQ